ncbi:hypothetical protein VNO77_10695 [Canavalia gladiata]|uniref:Dirigent protein n=1 Tax=Canavalia gladiata TaxID=3824 RepID=A0AAN9MG45_CANGL
MKRAMILVLALTLSVVTIPVRSKYYSESLEEFDEKEKVSHLHFYLFDLLSGDKPNTVEVARPNISVGPKSPTPFGHVYVIDDDLRDGPDANSTLVGNAQGFYVSSSQDHKLTLVVYADFGFITGKFNGSLS